MRYESFEKIIGNTPEVLLEKINDNSIFIKLEMMNLGGSVKDRIALRIIEDLIKEGKLGKEGQKAVEATSGNTGIGLAMVCALKGIPLTILMPENMSKERISLMESYGAKVILTPKEGGMALAEEQAKEMEKDGYVFLNQFGNHSNIDAHLEGTSKEIIKDFPDGIDYFVAGVGTSGTLSGCAKALKEAFPNIKIIAVEPEESKLLEGSKPGPHSIQGIGANFLPPFYEESLVDEIIPIKSSEAMKKANELAKKGFFLGISSAAAILAAEIVAKKENGKTILAISPDGGIKYMSLGIYGRNNNE